MTDYASLVFLSFNRPAYIFDALTTARENAGYPCEIIVVDDGSTDDEMRRTLVAHLQSGLISQLVLAPRGHNEGVGRSIRKGFSLATGDPIIKLDQDLIFRDGWLARTVGILRQDRSIGMFGFFKYHHEPVKWDDKKIDVPTRGGYHYTRQFCGSGFAIPRKVYEELGPLDQHLDAFNEDSNYMAKVRETEYELALPDVDFVENRGFGFGPSTVCIAPDKVQGIHHEPHVIRPSDGVLTHSAAAAGGRSSEREGVAMECRGSGTGPVESPSSNASSRDLPVAKMPPPQIEGDITPDAVEVRDKRPPAQESGREIDAPPVRSFIPGVVITTCAGREENLRRTVDNLMRLSLCTPHAIVVVYDGCPAQGFDTPIPVHGTEIPKHQPGNEQPRNVGFRRLREIAPECNYVWFLDSDLIFEDDILAEFARGFAAAPEDRILIGPYDWLAPGVVERVRDRAGGSKIGMLDPRWVSFDEHGPDHVLRHDLGAGLACFSGNLVYPVEFFEEIGGFHRDLHHGRCEDGEMGLRACEHGLPMSFVSTARAWHVYHEVDYPAVTAKNVRDVPLLNAMHPWVEQEGLRVVDKDGKRFDWKCPDCGGIYNTLDYWPHAQACKEGRIVNPEVEQAVEEEGDMPTPVLNAPPISIDGMPTESDEVSQDITVRKLDIRTFREAGFLHEINRLILHPCGLALEIQMDPATGVESLGAVWDCTEDPEGVLLGPDLLDPAKAQNVAEIIEQRGRTRVESLGFVIQPVSPDFKQLNVTVKDFITSRQPGPTIALNGANDEGEETPA